MRDLQPVLAGVGVNGLSDIYCSTVTSFYLIREREHANYVSITQQIAILHLSVPAFYYTAIFFLPAKEGSGVIDFCRLLDKGLFTEMKNISYMIFSCPRGMFKPNKA